MLGRAAGPLSRSPRSGRLRKSFGGRQLGWRLSVHECPLLVMSGVWSLLMNLTEWARAQGIAPRTAYRWFREGTLPVPAERVGPRTILVNMDANTSLSATGGVGLYARVSSNDQKADLERQSARLAEWAAKSGSVSSSPVSPPGNSRHALSQWPPSPACRSWPSTRRTPPSGEASTGRSRWSPRAAK
jgi:hypothetical protein